MCQAVIRIEGYRACEVAARFGIGVGAIVREALEPAQHAVVSDEIASALAPGAIDACRLDAPRQRGGDGGHHLVLYGEDVVERAIVAVCPKVSAAFGVDQLHGHAHPIACPAHAAFEEKTDAQPPPDLASIQCLPRRRTKMSGKRPAGRESAAAR